MSFTGLAYFLSDQCAPYGGEVGILACRDNFEHSIADKRNALIAAARAEYVSFVDDDDWVHDHYVDLIVPLLDGVDCIGYRNQMWTNYVAAPPTLHSIQYETKHWDTMGRWCAPWAHCQPTKLAHLREIKVTSLAYGADDDGTWQLAVTQKLRTEHWLENEEPIYHYYRSTTHSITLPGSERIPMDDPGPNPVIPLVEYVDV